MKEPYRFAKLHLKPQDIGNNVLFTDHTNLTKMFGNRQTPCHHNPLMSRAKHTGGEVMIWPCSVVRGPGDLSVTEPCMSSVHQFITE